MHPAVIAKPSAEDKPKSSLAAFKRVFNHQKSSHLGLHQRLSLSPAMLEHLDLGLLLSYLVLDFLQFGRLGFEDADLGKLGTDLL